MNVVKDPVDDSTNVLEVVYKKGTYCRSKPGGIQFKATKFPPQESAMLSYQLFFSENFDFVKGGKLPGFFGGSGICSGGRKQNCFSTRYMWRENGKGELYLYTPLDQTKGFCDRENVFCNFDYGHSVGNGTFVFTTGRWHQIQQYIKLNTPGQMNGIAKIWFDGTQVYSITDLNFRSNPDVKINALFFSTFFGGGSPDYATPNTVWAFFKNFEVCKHK
ncbi:unnamed protein product [Owenia fusiformis]|uniref:Polysaccharide lyase 14 domain-containing protein n=1 Tax=Owenia fusiformis TaxID=6347 RepID=A0A8J1XNG7_OWEFU|nr:unnamed protein product [Owenia fusiformis]